MLIAHSIENLNFCGSKDGVVMSALASHQRTCGSIPGLSVIMWIEFVDGSLLCSKRFFSSGTPVFPSPKNRHF